MARNGCAKVVSAAVVLLGACAHVPAWDAAHPDPAGPPPPLASSPADNARVDAPRPTFSWRLPGGENGAVIEICRDPACARALVHADAGASFTPERDLPSGLVYWRLRGRDGSLVGKGASPMRTLAVDTTATWSGTYVEVTVPASASDYGKRLVPLLDAAVVGYARMLGVKPPAAKVPLLFYTTDEAYKRAHGRGAPVAHESGFTILPRRNSMGETSVYDAHKLSCHIRFGDRLAGDDADASGNIEGTALHELAHAVAQQTIPLYEELPGWWVEGLSDLLASNALTEIWQVPLAHQPLFSNRLRFVAQAKTRLPLATLLDLKSQATQQLDADRMALLYAESFALLHHLDSTADPDRQRAFRALVRSVAGMSKLSGATAQLRALTGSLETFEPRWLAAVAAEPLFPWVAEGSAEVRVLPAEIAVGATVAHFGLARWAGGQSGSEARVEPGDRVEVLVDVHPDDERAGCLLAATTDRTLYAVCANDRGKAKLLRLSEHSTTIASGRLEHGLFAPGARRRLSLELGADRWVARVDGTVVLDTPAPGTPAEWGVAAVDGHAHYLGAHVVRRVAQVGAVPAM